MKTRKILLGSVITGAILFVGNSALAQLTTWKEDMNHGKAFEEKLEYAEAERTYRQALGNIPKVLSPNSKTQSYSNKNISIRQSYSYFNKNEGEVTDLGKLTETLQALLRVLNAQNKSTSAIAISRSLLTIKEHTSGPGDSSLAASKDSYKNVIERLETKNRWPTIKPLFKKHKFVGMDRTQVHEILGTPDAAALLME